MLTARELSMQRKATERFIAADPTEIILNTGGFQWINGSKIGVPSVTRDPQIFKLIWTGETGVVEDAPNGTRRFDFYIVGKFDAVVSISDFWKTGNQENRITFIYPSNGYEVKAGGVSHGPSPT